MDSLFADIVAEAFQKVRYCEPHPTDTNRARWPNAAIWDLAQDEAQGDLDDMRSHIAPEKVKYVHRQEHIRLMMAQVIGNTTTLAALEGVQESDLPDYVTRTGRPHGNGPQRRPRALRHEAGSRKGKVSVY